MKMTDEQMIEVGDFVTICTNGNDFLGDKSMFDGMVGEVLEINGAIKPVYKVRVIIESLFSDRELFCQKKGNADNDELKKQDDVIEHPAHYTQGKIEVIDFIEDQKLNYHLGNCVKYICRCFMKHKDKPSEDLKKARWYLNREIKELEKDGR